MVSEVSAAAARGRVLGATGGGRERVN